MFWRKKMINNVTLVGRLVRRPELRYTPSNIAVATFTLAVNRMSKNEAGEREADFINCVIWRQSAENLANWTDKGHLIGVVGKIQTRTYENDQGQRVFVTEVIANQFYILESRKNQDNNNQGYNQGQQQNQGQYQNQGGFQAPSNQNGFQAPQSPNQQSYGNQSGNFQQGPNQGYNQPFGPQQTNPMDISDDDLPF